MKQYNDVSLRVLLDSAAYVSSTGVMKMSSVDCQGTSAAKAPVQLPVILQYLNVSWARNSITCRRLQNPYSASISSGRTCEGGLHKSGKFRSTWIRSNLTHIYNVKGSSPSMELASFNEPALSPTITYPAQIGESAYFCQSG